MEWQHESSIQRVINRWCVFWQTLNQNLPGWVANRIDLPACRSLETDLAFYNLIPVCFIPVMLGLCYCLPTIVAQL